MRRAAPLTFRWLIAGIVAVLTLLGSAVRISPIEAPRVRAALEHVERTRDGDRAHLERPSALSRVRVARPSGGADPAAGEPALRAFAFRPHVLRVAALRAPLAPARAEDVVRRVRPHVEHMVFLI